MADACDLQWTRSLYISQKTFATASLLAALSAFLAVICFCLLNRNMLKDIGSLHFSSVQGCIESLWCGIVTDFFFYWLFFPIASTLYATINVWFFLPICVSVWVFMLGYPPICGSQRGYQTSCSFTLCLILQSPCFSLNMGSPIRLNELVRKSQKIFIANLPSVGVLCLVCDAVWRATVGVM